MNVKFYVTLCMLTTAGLISAQTADFKGIPAKVNKEAWAYRQKLKKIDGMDSMSVDFSVDTFKIERTMALQIEKRPSTQDMNAEMRDATDAYDKLLNNYYTKLMAKLKGADKQTLAKAEKAWLAFRDAEMGLIGVAGKPEYSGGGTIQTNIDNSTYYDLVKQRVTQIFNHYERVSGF